MLLVAPAWGLVWLLTSAAHQAPALLLSPHPGWESLFFHLSGHSIQCASCLDCRKLTPTPTAPYANSACKALPQTLFFRKPIPIMHVYSGAYILVPAVFPHGFNPVGSSSYLACCCWPDTRPEPLLAPFVPPLLVRGPGMFLGRSSLPFWTTSVYRIFSEF